MNSNIDILKIRNLRIKFKAFEGIVEAVDGVDLDVREGEVLGLVGESGCGKSITARAILGLNPSPPAIIEGEILMMSKDECEFCAGNGCVKCFKTGKKFFDLLRLDEKEMENIRGRDISMVFQQPTSFLNPVFTIGQQIDESYLIHQKKDVFEEAIRLIDQGIDDSHKERSKKTWRDYSPGKLTRTISKLQKSVLKKMGEKWKDKWYSVFIVRIPLVNGFRRYVEMAARNRSLLMLRKVEIPNPTKVIDQYPHELSGGMQQRVLIAMALGCGARLLIANEPTTALDVTTQATILQLMKDLKSELGSSLLFITHDLGVICSMCDRVAVMYAGVIQEIAPVQDIFKHSLHPYTRLLLESMPKIRESQEFLGTIPGTVPILINPPKGCRFHARCPEAKEICAKERPILSRIDNDHWVACFNKTD